MGIEAGTSDLLDRERHLVRKLDVRMMPFLSLLFLLAFLDRVNIGHARLYGLEKSLKLTPEQYAWGLSIFFIGYVLFEIPSNLMMQRISPPKWIARIMVTWGIVTVCTAAVKDATGLLVTRFFLGVFEAGMFPGVVFYLGSWYTREEQALRISIFFSASLVAGAFGGLLSYLINGLDGAAGLHSWQWIYIIEGVPTVLLGIMAWFVLPNNPQDAPWLLEEERSLLISRLEANHVEVKSKLDFKQLLHTLLDPTTYLYVLAFFGCCSPLYSMALLLPTIINGLGFPPLYSLLLTIPPYSIALVAALSVAGISDRMMNRSKPTLVCSFLGVIGFGGLLLVHSSPWIQYALLNLVVPSAASCFPTILSWSNNNVPGGSTQSATTSALVIMSGNIGGILAGQLYRPSDAPNFTSSHSICLSWLALTFVSTFILRICLQRKNQSIIQQSNQTNFHANTVSETPFYYIL